MYKVLHCELDGDILPNQGRDFGVELTFCEYPLVIDLDTRIDPFSGYPRNC